MPTIVNTLWSKYRASASGWIRGSGRAMGTTVYNKDQMRLHALAIVTVLTVVSLDLACDRVPLTAPTSSTINVTVDQSTLPLNGQATVRAVVIESGGVPVHNGTQVTFATTLGSFVPPTSETIDGVARTIFFAGSISGSTKINAYSGGASTGSGNSSSGGVTVLIGAAAAKTIAVSATPSSVSQSGGTVTVSALVMDESGNPLPGVNVIFSADTGQVAPTSALSDTTGVARTQLTTTQTSKVTATAGAATRDVTVTVSAAPTVTVDAPSPASPIAGQPVTFTVTTTSGNTTAPRQVQTLDVNFGDGTAETRSNVTGAAAFTHIYTREGGYTITARAVDVGGNTGLGSRAIIVGFAQQPSVTISSSKSNPAVNEVFTVTVVATQSTGGAPIRSVVVKTNDGTVLYTSSSSGSQQFSASFSSSGSRTLIATTTDAAGQTASSSIVITVP